MTTHDILSTLKASTGLDWKQEGETLVCEGKYLWNLQRNVAGGWNLSGTRTHMTTAIGKFYEPTTLAACAEVVRREET